MATTGTEVPHNRRKADDSAARGVCGGSSNRRRPAERRGFFLARGSPVMKSTVTALSWADGLWLGTRGAGHGSRRTRMSNTAGGREYRGGERLADLGLLIGLALLASLISIRIAVSVALVEIVVGAFGGNLLGLTPTDWVNYLAGVGAIMLTFLAGHRDRSGGGPQAPLGDHEHRSGRLLRPLSRRARVCPICAGVAVAGGTDRRIVCPRLRSPWSMP